MINKNVEEYWKRILDKWLKKESKAFVEERKAEGAVLTEKEEHYAMRSYEAGVLKGLQLSIELQPKYMDFLKKMNKDIMNN